MHQDRPQTRIGAYGDVVLGESSTLSIKFAVKMISPTHYDQYSIEEIRKTLFTKKWSGRVGSILQMSTGNELIGNRYGSGVNVLFSGWENMILSTFCFSFSALQAHLPVIRDCCTP